jgi:pilus assembly protein CpaB
MKKYIPLVLAAVVFLLALFLLQPESTAQVVVLAADLPAGHTLISSDMVVREIPVSFQPVDAVAKPSDAVGKILKNDHSAGDILRVRHLGQPITLAADERAVSINVDDSSGMGGLIAPGDIIGISAVIFGNNVVFSKVTAEGFRVLYVTPEFRAGYGGGSSGGVSSSSVSIANTRSNTGTVVLAVPTTLIDVKYDFTYLGGNIEVRKVNMVELISILTASSNSKIILYKLPANAATMESPGLYLPDLVIIPTPSPEPTTMGTPEGTPGGTATGP